MVISYDSVPACDGRMDTPITAALCVQILQFLLRQQSNQGENVSSTACCSYIMRIKFDELC